MKQLEITDSLSMNAEREDRPKSKKTDKSWVRLGQRCEVCGNIFAKRHPTEERNICDKCMKEKR